MRTLTFEIDGPDAEPLADALIEAGALAISTEDSLADTPFEQAQFDATASPSGWSRVRVKALFPDAADAAAALREACRAASIAVPQGHIGEVPDDDWVRRSQEEFRPIQAGTRLWIVPTWHAAPDPRAINIALDPGMAFGTGSHPTTRLCLGWLERVVAGGETVLDYGCGSGILAIAAMKLGAARACGVDIDAAALRTATENAARNFVRCDFHAPGDLPMAMADIVVANILANPLRLLAPLLTARARRGARLGLAGILANQAGEVRDAYRRWFDFEPEQREGEWILLTGRRNAIGC